jgi:hypothetical protein
MSEQNLEARGHDPARSRLRATVTKMKDELATLASAGAAEQKTAREALVVSFDDLVEQLALGPEPELRECPNCGGVCMRQATVCSGCWKKLTPPA